MNLWEVQVTYWHKQDQGHPAGGYEATKSVYVVTATMADATALAEAHVGGFLSADACVKLNTSEELILDVD